MSSLIEWPSLYGSSYFLPAIVVAALLLALLLLMSSRRRRALDAARNASEPLEDAETPAPDGMAEAASAETAVLPAVRLSVVAATTEPAASRAFVAAPSFMTAPVLTPPPVTAAAPIVAAAPVLVAPPAAVPAPVAVTASSLREPALAVAGAAVPATPLAAAVPGEADAPIPALTRLASGRDARITVRTQGSVSGAPGNDPLNAALLDILDGWGDLSPEDRKRLELFRPERLVSAVAAVELPNSKSSEAKARLSLLRQYASDLERRSLYTQAAAAKAAAEPVTEAVAVPATAAATFPAATAVVAPAATSRATDEAATAPAATVAAATTNVTVPSGSAAAGLAAAVALGASERTTPRPSAEPFVLDGPDTIAAAAGAAALTSRPRNIDDLTSFWAEPRPLWEPGEGTSPEELPAPTYHEVDAAPETPSVSSAEAAVEHSPNGNGHEPEPVDAASAAPEPVDAASAAPARVDRFFWDDVPADPLSRLSVKVETAEQLLALPPQERADMTAFLEPSELAATFRATEDPELKKAVIDTLEHIGSPASLNALGNCFEDADCDVQLYALQAADRLLGVA